MKQDHFLDLLDWHEPTARGFSHTFERVPLVIETDEGEIIVVGDVNALSGTCGCCQRYFRIKRWAYLFEE